MHHLVLQLLLKHLSDLPPLHIPGHRDLVMIVLDVVCDYQVVRLGHEGQCVGE